MVGGQRVIESLQLLQDEKLSLLHNGYPEDQLSCKKTKIREMHHKKTVGGLYQLKGTRAGMTAHFLSQDKILHIVVCSCISILSW